RAVAAGDAALDDRPVRVAYQDPVAAVVFGKVGVPGVVGGDTADQDDILVGVVVRPTLPRPIDVDAEIQVLPGRAPAKLDVAEAEASPALRAEAGEAVGDPADVEAGPAEPAGLDVLDPDTIEPSCVGPPVEHQDAEARARPEAVAHDGQITDHD